MVLVRSPGTSCEEYVVIHHCIRISSRTRTFLLSEDIAHPASAPAAPAAVFTIALCAVLAAFEATDEATPGNAAAPVSTMAVSGFTYHEYRPCGLLGNTYHRRCVGFQLLHE